MTTTEEESDTEERPWCIRHTQVKSKYEGTTLCGRPQGSVELEMHFRGVDHWLNATLKQAGIPTCEKCLEKLVDLAEGGEP